MRVKILNKLPPIEKIYEAYSAISDHRITLNTNDAKIISSDGSKEYFVKWDANVYASNDSSTYWQGYAGYPVLAVLMLQGKLPFNKDMANRFSGVNWAQLNSTYKRNYAQAVEAVFDHMQCSEQEKENIKQEVQQVFNSIKALDITTKRGSSPKKKGA